MHLDFIVGRVPTNGWAAAGKRQAGFSSPHPKTHTHTSCSSTLPPLVHIHELEPPRPEVQAWIPAGFLIQTSPVEQPESTLPLLSPPQPRSFYFSRSRSGPVGLNQLPPHVPAARAHTHAHLNDSAQRHTHHLVVQSWRAKSFWAAHQSSLWSRTLSERGGVGEQGADDLNWCVRVCFLWWWCQCVEVMSSRSFGGNLWCATDVCFAPCEQQRVEANKSMFVIIIFR